MLQHQLHLFHEEPRELRHQSIVPSKTSAPSTISREAHASTRTKCMPHTPAKHNQSYHRNQNHEHAFVEMKNERACRLCFHANHAISLRMWWQTRRKHETSFLGLQEMQASRTQHGSSPAAKSQICPSIDLASNRASERASNQATNEASKPASKPSIQSINQCLL